MSSIVERTSHIGITGTGDPSRVIHFAEMATPGCWSEVGGHGSRAPETIGIIDYGFDPARLHANDLEACLLQTIGQILGERAGFQANAGDLDIKRPQIADDVLGFRGQPGPRPDIALIVDHTDVNDAQ